MAVAKATLRRIVLWHSEEPPEFRTARMDYVMGMAGLTRETSIPPAVPVWWTEFREAERRRDDPAFDVACQDIENRLAARDPRWVQRHGDEVMYDFTRAPDLREEWTRVQDAAEARHIARMPPLAVKPGDFVDVGGHPLRVRSVDVLRRTAALEMLDANGSVIASDSAVRAENLRPIFTPTGSPAPQPPAHLSDGLAAARFNKASLRQLLASAGLDDD